LLEVRAHGFRAGTLTALEDFVTMIRSFQSMLSNTNAYDLAFHIGKHTNLVKELFNDKSTEGVQRYENIQELLNSIKEWTESPDTEDGELVDKSLGAYLQQITLLTDADETDVDADTVKMMTIHAAKGLEFRGVFAVGLEEMLFPNAMAINTREELEEERRLFYVVITRAKEKLWISYANTRYRFGQLVQNEPSRFLDEIPADQVERSSIGHSAVPGSRWGGASANQRLRGWRTEEGDSGRPQTQPRPYYQEKSSPDSANSWKPVKPAPKVVEHTPSSDFQPSDTSDLQVGQRVEHQKFGFGEVIKMEGSAHNPIATVHFEKNGEKKIMLQYARLRIVN
jgi:DNA helicase-2/ATP-dependent DNA helicase PcrA